MGKKYVDQNLTELLGLDSVSDRQKKSVMDFSTRIVGLRCLSKVLDSVDRKDRKTFVAMLESGEDVGSFLEERKIDLLDVLQGEVVQFKKEVVKKVGV